MTKNMQKIVLFIEPNEDAFMTPLKIGNLFLNRFAVEEDAAFEVLKIFEFKKRGKCPESWKMSEPWKMSDTDHSEYKKLEEENNQKGMDLIT